MLCFPFLQFYLKISLFHLSRNWGGNYHLGIWSYCTDSHFLESKFWFVLPRLSCEMISVSHPMSNKYSFSRDHNMSAQISWHLFAQTAVECSKYIYLFYIHSVLVDNLGFISIVSLVLWCCMCCKGNGWLGIVITFFNDFALVTS